MLAQLRNFGQVHYLTRMKQFKEHSLSHARTRAITDLSSSTINQQWGRIQASVVGRGPGRDHAVHALVFMQALFTYIRELCNSTRPTTQPLILRLHSLQP